MLFPLKCFRIFFYSLSIVYRESIQSLLQKYQAEKKGDSEDFQIIRVRRKHLWEDCLRAVSKNSFRKNVQLKVHFIGEDAEDEGGPLREFLRLALLVFWRGQMTGRFSLQAIPSCFKRELIIVLESL